MVLSSRTLMSRTSRGPIGASVERMGSSCATATPARERATRRRIESRMPERFIILPQRSTDPHRTSDGAGSLLDLLDRAEGTAPSVMSVLKTLSRRRDFVFWHNQELFGEPTTGRTTNAARNVFLNRCRRRRWNYGRTSPHRDRK